MDDLRDLLHDAAEQMRLDPELPPKTLRRARRRRARNAALAGALTIAVIGGGFVGARMVIGGPGTLRPAQEDLDLAALEGPMWPQSTVADATAAQSCADTGDEACTWQLDPHQVAERYGMEELGWDATFIDRAIPSDSTGIRLLRIGSCSDVGTKKSTGEAACMEEADIALIQPTRIGTSGIWTVATKNSGRITRVDSFELPPPELVAFERALMVARLRGSGAEELMTPKAMDAYNSIETGLSLYKDLVKQPGHEIVGYEAGDEPGEFSVGVMIDTQPQTFEGWSVGPGRNVDGERRPMVLRTVFRGTLGDVSPQAAATGSPRGAVIQVLNGTSVNGLAVDVARELEIAGYAVNQIANASREYAVTTLFYRPDSIEIAQRLAADLFPGARLEPANNNLNIEVQVTVLIGKDYQPM